MRWCRKGVELDAHCRCRWQAAGHGHGRHRHGHRRSGLEAEARTSVHRQPVRIRWLGTALDGQTDSLKNNRIRLSTFIEHGGVNTYVS